MKKHALFQVVLFLGVLLSQPRLDSIQKTSTCRMDGMGGSQPKEVCLLTKFLETLRKTGVHKHGHNILLFVGKSETGKTMGAEKIAENSGVPYDKYSAKELAAKGAAGIAMLNKLFDSTKNLTQPYIIIIDDLDKIDHKKHILLISVLNVHLQNAFENENLIVIMTARNMKPLDDALKNRCHTIFWELPNQEDRRQLFEFYLEGKAHKLDEEDLMHATEETNRFSAKDIRNTIALAENLIDVENSSHISPEHLNKAIKEKRSLVDEKNPSNLAKTLKKAGAATGAGFVVYRIYRFIKKSRTSN